MAIEISLITVPIETWTMIIVHATSTGQDLDEYLLQCYGATWKPGSNDVWIFPNKEKYTEFCLTWL